MATERCEVFDRAVSDLRGSFQDTRHGLIALEQKVRADLDRGTVNRPTTSAQVAVCDPDNGIDCEYCGCAVTNGMTDVVIEKRPGGVIVFCSPACANQDHRETVALREMGLRGEESPF